ncbi:NAD(P)H-dependent oxidoreductase subunit E [Bacteroidota bacterium]
MSFESGINIFEVGSDKSKVIPLLHAIQTKYNYLPEPALRRVCDITDISPADITGISTFYSQFRHKPVGEHIIQVCHGTACHVKGSELVHEAFMRELDIGDDQDTDADGQFTLQKVACLGCCTIAPVVQIGNVTYGHVKTDGISKIFQDFISYRQAGSKAIDFQPVYRKETGEVKIGLGSCCVANGSYQVYEALEKSCLEVGIQPQVKRVGCVGMCHRTPLLEVCLPGEEPVLYDKVTHQDVKKILLKHYRPEKFTQRIKNTTYSFLENFLYEKVQNEVTRHPLHYREKNIETFLGRQVHIATEHSGQIDPLDLEEYRSKQGFKAYENCIKNLSSEEIINEIQKSGLRGRGGAGYPTADKWQLAYKAEGSKKYIICNGDEGDPGAFMDRMILESYPYRVIEGMSIAAYAVGADEGYFYIRREYPLAVERVRSAIEQCEKAGLLGDNIKDSGFSLKLKMMEGAGAFVCGEETALIASLEGKRGNPSIRPPYPVHKGLWGHPTLVNNCETYATVPWIFRNGYEKYSKLGTEKSKGTKVFSLAGKVVRGGLIEVPMGITIGEIVVEIGGGIENGREFKAVQIGGPSGGCVPAELADTKVDYEDLTKVGAMMGSGGLLVMDDQDCMVDISRYFLSFTCDQSCGKCTFCRIGTHLMLGILDKICAGKADESDLSQLKIIAAKTKERSLCGLGKTAPNPVLTTLTYFEDEYKAHLNGVCPAKRCKELITYTITDSCIGCTVCAQNCPVDAIAITPYSQHEIDQEKCTKCDLCKQVCPNESVQVI